MNLRKRPKLHPPLALLAAPTPAARAAGLDPVPGRRCDELRRLVAAMID